MKTLTIISLFILTSFACSTQNERSKELLDEISFEEFFIWWYHFIYTQATDILAERGKLIIPKGGNFYYK